MIHDSTWISVGKGQTKIVYRPIKENAYYNSMKRYIQCRQNHVERYWLPLLSQAQTKRMKRDIEPKR